MKIGILQCDHVREDLQPDFGDYPPMFVQLLSEAAPDWEYRVYPLVDGQFPQRVDECDGYITTGSRHGVNDGFPWIDRTLELVREIHRRKIRYVGICFGHQLLARALGGRVEKSPRGWGVGVSFNQIVDQRDWMAPWQPGMDLVVSHQDQVTELPPGAEVLASSSFCPFYMMQIDGHMLGVQGHPEFSRPYSAALMDKRRDIIDPNRIREGMASLKAEVDDKLMVRWIVNFFAGKPVAG